MRSVTAACAPCNGRAETGGKHNKPRHRARGPLPQPPAREQYLPLVLAPLAPPDRDTRNNPALLMASHVSAGTSTPLRHHNHNASESTVRPALWPQ